MLESSLIRSNAPRAPALRFDVATDNLSDRHDRSPFACLRRLVELLEVAAAGEKTPSVFSLSKTDEKIEEKFADYFKEIENRVVLKAKMP